MKREADKVSNPELIVRYLLGETISESQQAEFERRLFVDDEFLEGIQAIEFQLMARYLRNDLSARERELFESHFLLSQERRNALEFVRGLSNAMDSEARKLAEAPGSRLVRWPFFLIPNLAGLATRQMRVAILILLGVLLVGGGLWSFRSRRAINSSNETASKETAVTTLVDPSVTPASALSATAWAGQGQALLARYDRRGNVDKAIQSFKRALERDGNYAVALASLADAYLQKNAESPDPQWLRLASDSARKSVQLNPDLAVAHMAQGIVNLSARQMEEARRELQRARDLDPANAEVWMWLAEYYAQSVDKARAEDFFKQAVLRNSDYWPAYGRWGSFLYKESRYSEAINVWETARARTPDNIIILNNLGAAYISVSRYEDAASTFQRALELEPTASIYNNLGTARFFQGHYSDAAATFEKAVDKNATSYRYWGNLGDARRWTPSEAARANEAYSNAIRLVLERLMEDPDDTDLQSSLAVYYAKSGDRKRADDALARLEMLPNRTPGSYFKAAVGYEISGDRSKALEALERAIEANYSLLEIKNEPELTSLRTDRRYQTVSPANTEIRK
jgi:tetratricopeptide (TPR) repeat protein